MEKIFEEGEKIYPISDKSQRCDERLAGHYTIENWAEMVYHLKEGKSKERFIELMKKTEYSYFFEGLNFEYGINKFPKNLIKSFQIYKEAANNSNDSMSMFRMYHIYKNDFKKFNISKRNRVLEKFYLFKCFSFLRYPILDNDQDLLNRFDIPEETNIHFEEEDEDFSLFSRFIKFLKNNYKLYEINLDDVLIIESVIDYKIKRNFENGIKNLKNLANKNNLEALYKLTCFEKDTNDEETEKRFNFLFSKEYYRSYIDYALYLNKKNNYTKALEILKIAKNNGFVSAGFLYFDIFLENVDFSLFMNEAINSPFSKGNELYNLFQILIDDILTESVYSFFEFIFLRKIVVKHYDFEEKFNNHFYDYMKEIVNFLMKIAGDINVVQKTKMIKKYFCNYAFFKELYLACGTLYFYGINNLVNIDVCKALNNFIISYKSSESDSYKRFCYYYIYRTLKKMYEENKLNQSNHQILTYSISEEKIKNIEKKLFNKYNSSINDDIKFLSSSYFYYLSRLFNKKIGNDGGEKLLEFIYLKRAMDSKNDQPSLGSIINIYRKNKSKIILEKKEKEFKEEFNNMILYNDSEGYGEDGSICPICYTNKRNVIVLPCKHLFCDFCLEHFEKCPICRSSILIKHSIG